MKPVLGPPLRKCVLIWHTNGDQKEPKDWGAFEFKRMEKGEK